MNKSLAKWELKFLTSLFLAAAIVILSPRDGFAAGNALETPPPAAPFEIHPSASKNRITVPQSFDELQHRLGQIETLKSDFTQSRFLRLLKKPLVSKGSMSYKKDRAICWLLNTPVPASVLLTRDQVKVEDQGSGVMSVPTSNPLLKVFTDLFFAVFSGDARQLEEKFSHHWKSTPEDWELILTPTDALIETIATSVNISGTDRIRTVVIHHQSGDYTQLTFQHGLLNQSGSPLTECRHDKA